MRQLLLASLALFSCATTLAGEPVANADNHCFAQVEAVVFHCATDKGKWVSICADAQSSTPGFVQYRYGKKDAVELRKPDVGAPLSRWTYNESAMARGMQRTAAFENEGYTYTVFVTEAGMDTAAGVTVEKGGKTLATLTCANQEFNDSLASLESILPKKAEPAKAE